MRQPVPRVCFFSGASIGALEAAAGTAGNDRPIDLLDLALGKQPAEAAQRLRMAAEHQTAAGVAVEPMRQGRRPRQTEAQRVEPGFEIGAAARTGMHRDAGRLIDDQHQPVAIEHPLEELDRRPLRRR